MKLTFLLGLIVIIWVGMILGIGMESIVKFNTLTLTKPVGFDVGRVVFGAFNKVQAILLVVLIIGAFLTPIKPLNQCILGMIAIILFLQMVWLFPELSARVDLILQGKTPSPTRLHAYYSVLEISKLTLLLILGVRLLSLR